MATARVPSLAIQFSEEEITTVQFDVAAILRSGRLILGPYTEAFEASIAAMAGTSHAVATSSGTSALEIIFRSIGVAGRTVLVPTNTNYATAAAAANAGAVVRFYDNDLYPDITDIQRQLTEDVAAVVVVHIGGYLVPELPTLVALCARAGVPLVEDAAHAHGARLNGRAAGAWGHAGAFSFYPTKVITSGEGGAITTDDSNLAAAARRYRDQGKNPDSLLHTLWGNSWRITEIGAALALAQLSRLDRDALHRRQTLSRYRHRLGDVAGITLPVEHVGHQPSGYKAIAVLGDGLDRAAFKADVLAMGVELGREVYEVPLHQQPVLAGLKADDSHFPRADHFTRHHICLPLWRGITHAEAQQAADAVIAALNNPARHLARGLSSSTGCQPSFLLQI